MGRPRRHDDATAQALLRAAERIVEADGLEALTVRAVADAVGTTTRAVYTVFGSKEGLLVALGRRGFELLEAQIEALPVTDDPVSDLVQAGLVVFRRFALEHPALFAISIQRALPDPALAAGFRRAGSEALAGLELLIARVQEAGLLGGRTVREGATAFHALCEGLAAMELRVAQQQGAGQEGIWRDALTALVRGFSVSAGSAAAPQRAPRGTRTRGSRRAGA
jgi:AcrR family transcriptional regulator